jgi:uncharacterized protein YndB with AHSA1/START domain
VTERKHRGRQLVVEMRTRATPEQVYEAWADPEKIAHWFVDRARGKAEVGEIFTWIFEKFGYEIPYEVVAAEPGRRFALGGEAPKSGPFLLEVTIAREGGETVVTLVNSGFLDGSQWDEEFEGIVSGWTSGLALLKHYLENYPGRPKTTILVMQPAAVEFSNLLPFYATAEGLGRWLTTSASISGGGAVGDACALRLPAGESLTGRVLAKTKWETAFSWEEVDGVLELKAFRFPGTGPMVAARVVSWNLTPERAAEIERRLQEALGKLAALVGAASGAPTPAGVGR